MVFTILSIHWSTSFTFIGFSAGMITHSLGNPGSVSSVKVMRRGSYGIDRFCL